MRKTLKEILNDNPSFKPEKFIPFATSPDIVAEIGLGALPGQTVLGTDRYSELVSLYRYQLALNTPHGCSIVKEL